MVLLTAVFLSMYFDFVFSNRGIRFLARDSDQNSQKISADKNFETPFLVQPVKIPNNYYVSPHPPH